jgi:uncharacterized circularly permuted ATP-grasp superfamily protein
MGIDPRALDLASIDPGYDSASVIARVDCFTPGDHPWILELNGESPAGIAYTDALSEMMATDPLMSRYRHLSGFSSSEAVIRAMLATWEQWSGSRNPAPRIAIVDFREVPTLPEFHLFQRQFERRGLDCTVADPRDLHWDGRALVLGGKPIDLVYRRLLVSDFLGRPEECKAVLAAYRAGAICMVNSLKTPLLHGKGLFALMHHGPLAESLSASERRLVAEHIPETALLADSGPLSPDGLLERVRQEREDWVIKPISGHGGAGVILGWESSESEWDAALEGSRSHVVQRRVPELVLPFPDARENYALTNQLVDLDPFLIRGRLAGFLCRLSPGGLANVTSGATVVPVFALP